MNKDSENILNIINTNTNLLSHTIENIVADVKNEDLKNYFCETLNNLDVFKNDCKMIMKADNKEIDKLSFLEKAQNLISIKLSNLKITRDYAEVFFLNCCEILPELIFAKIDCNLCDDEEKVMLSNLISLTEASIEKMKEFFTALD